MKLQLKHTISFLLILLLFLLFFLNTQNNQQKRTSVNGNLINAYKEKTSDIIVSGSGRVIKILSDDLKGRKHQKFIVKVEESLTLLIAHNIDLAPRINDLKTGDTISFTGEYEWNPKGGIIHWTHRDPKGNHPEGWIKHKGTIYR